MHKFRRALAAAGMGALLMGTALAGTAAAQGQGQGQGRGPGEGVTLACGTTVTHSVKLAADIGPCATTDGLIVTGSNIIVDLNGHAIIGSHQNCPGTACNPDPHEQVGIQLNGASGDTVMNGTVAYFDGGVVVQGGSGNTVRRIDAHDNINSNDLTNKPLPPPGIFGGTYQNRCENGDGIAVFSSNNNRILDNTTVHNGPYDGIAVVGIMVSGKFGSANDNVIQGNRSMDNYIADQTVNGGSTLCGGSKAGADYFGMGTGRLVQDMGIRIEGPDAAYNTVKANRVANNGLAGIAVFDYFCNLHNNATRGTIPHEPANHNNTIVGNTVSGTGDAAVQAVSGQVDPSANGISILAQGNPFATCTAYDNTIARNTSTGNFKDGIFVGSSPSAPGHPQHTTVINNVVDNNTVDGIGVSVPSPNGLRVVASDNVLIGNSGHGNGEFDGADYNANCDSNVWMRNRFVTVNQPCVANHGTGTVTQVVATGASGSVSAKTLTVTWSDAVNVSNPGGFTVYSDSTCSTLVGTGTSVVKGNGTMSPTVSLDGVPPQSTRGHPAYYEVAANSVSTPNGVANAAVPCSSVSFGP